MPIYLGHGTIMVWRSRIVSRLIQQRSDQAEATNWACVFGFVFSNDQKKAV